MSNLTKREQLAAMIMQALIEKMPNERPIKIVNEAIDLADLLIIKLEENDN